MGDFLNNTSHTLGALQDIHMNHCTNIQPCRCENNPLRRTNPFLTIQREIHFLSFFSFHRNTPKLLFRMKIWTFSFQNSFWNQFLTSGRGSTHIRVFPYFQFDNFLKSKIDFESSFEMRSSIFLY